MIPKRGAIAIGLTAIALVLLVSFRTPADITTATDGSAASGSDAGTGAVSGADGSTGSGATEQAQTGERVVQGPVVSTRWGPVQVSITVTDGRLTDIEAVQLPDGDRRSLQISTRAEPTLRSQALEAQGADIDGVSGATYTSVAYARSLQAALDSAGI